MDVTEFLTCAKQIQTDRAALGEKVSAALKTLSNLSLQQTISTATTQGQLPFSAGCSEHQAPRKQPTTEDAAQNLKNLEFNPTAFDTESAEIRPLMLRFFEDSAKNIKFEGKGAPLLADQLEAEIVRSGQIPVVQPGDILTFMLQDQLGYLVKLKTLRQKFVFRLRNSRSVTDLGQVTRFEKDITNQIAATAELVEKICSTCSSAFVKLPETVLQQVVKLGLSPVKQLEPYVTTADVDSTLEHCCEQQTQSQILTQQLQLTSVSRRAEIVTRALQIATQMTEERTPLVDLGKDSLVEQIQRCRSFQEKEFDLSKFAFQHNVTLEGEYNYVPKSCLDNLQDEDKIYGRPVSQEAACSKLLQKALCFFQSMANILPDFAVDGLKKIDVGDALQVFLATDGGEQKYSVRDLEITPIDKLKCAKKNVQKLYENKTHKTDKQDVCELLFDKFTPPADINFDIAHVLALVQAKSPSEREAMQNTHVKKLIDQKKELARNNSELAGVTQLINTAEYVRFVDLNVEYAELVVQTSLACGYIKKSFEYQEYCYNNYNGLHKSTEEIKQKGKRQVNLQEEPPISKLASAENDFSAEVLNNSIFMDLKRGATGQFQPSKGFFITDHLIDETGTKVIFKQAMAMVESLMKEVATGLTQYIKKLEEQMRLAWLRVVVYKTSEHGDQLDLHKMTIEQLLSRLSADAKSAYDGFGFTTFIDSPKILHEAVQYEVELMTQKVVLLKCLFEVLQTKTDDDQVERVQMLMLSTLRKRPTSYATIGSTLTTFEEQQALFAAITFETNVQDFVYQAALTVHSPLTLVSNQVNSTKYLASVIDKLVALDRADLEDLQSNSFPKLSDAKLHFFGYEDFDAILDLFETYEQSVADLMQIFRSECAPHVMQRSVLKETGQTLFEDFDGFYAKQQVAAELALSEQLVTELAVLIRKQRTYGTVLHANTKHLGDQGILNFKQLRSLVDDSVARLKLRYDQTGEEQGVHKAIAEYHLAKIISLKTPPTGGIAEDGTPGAAARTLLNVLNLRDVYLNVESAIRDQIDSFVPECCFTRYWGVGALPLPFAMRARALNLLYGVKMLNKQVMQAHCLVKCAARCTRAAAHSHVTENQVVVFSRTKITIDSQKTDYRIILGPQCVTNNLPYICTIDPWTARYMLTEYDLYDPIQVQRILMDEQIAEVQNLQALGENILSFKEIIALQNKSESSTLFDGYSKGYLGVIIRVAFAENAMNCVRLATLRNSMCGVNFAVLSQYMLGNVYFPEVEDLEPRLMLFDQNDFFKQGIDKYEIFKNDVQKYSQQQSTLYLKAVEDFIYMTTMNIQLEYISRIKALSQKEVNDNVTFGMIQSEVLTLAKYCIDESQKHANQAQLKSYLQSLRTMYSKVNTEETPLVLENAPVFRGLGQIKSDTQQMGFFINEENVVEHVESLPHPVMVLLDQYTLFQLECIVIFAYCCCCISRFGLLKNNLFELPDFEAGERLSTLLEYIGEVRKVNWHDGVVQVPSFLYLETEELRYLKLQKEEKLQETKMFCILNKSCQLTETLADIYDAALARCETVCLSKGLFNLESQFKRLVKRQNPLQKQLIAQLERPFSSLQQQTLAKIYNTSIKAELNALPPEACFRSSYSWREALPVHTLPTFLERKPETLLNSRPVSEFVGQPLGFATATRFVLSRRVLDARTVHQQLNALVFRFRSGGRVVESAEFDCAEHAQKTAKIVTGISQTAGLGFGLEGMKSQFDPFHPVSIGATTLSSVITQIELDAVYINAAGRTVKRNDELQNQWGYYRYQMVLARNIQQYEQLDKILSHFGFRMSVNDIYYDEPFRKAFEIYIKTMPQPEVQTTIKAAQEATTAILAKRHAYKGALSNDFVRLTEENIGLEYFTANSIRSLQECGHLLRAVFVERAYHLLYQMGSKTLFRQIEDLSNMIQTKLTVDKSLPQISDQFSLLQAKYAPYVADSLQAFYKYDQDLSPFPANAGATLQQQILQLFGYLCGQLNKNEAGTARQLIQIMAKDTNPFYSQLLSKFQVIFENLLSKASTGQLFQTFRSQMNLVLERHVHKFYGEFKRERRLIRDQGFPYEEVQCSVELTEIMQALNSFYSSYIENMADLKAVQQIQEDRFNIFSKRFQDNCLVKQSQLVPHTTSTTELIEWRATGLLNPAVFAEIQQICALQHEICAQGTLMLELEDAERDRLHCLFQDKICAVIDQVYHERLKRASIQAQKLRIVRQSVIDVRSDLGATVKRVTELNKFCKDEAVRTQMRFGLSPVAGEAENVEVDEAEPFDDQNQAIVERYQASIKGARDELGAARKQVLAVHGITQLALLAKQRHLDEIQKAVKYQLSETSKQVWDLQTVSQSLQASSEQRLFKVVQMIAEKMSAAEKMKKQLDSAEKQMKSDQQKPAVKQLLKKNLNGQIAMRTLSVLGNESVQKHLKLMNEGETLLLQYKNAMTELDKMKLDIVHKENELGIATTQQYMELEQTKRDIVKEREIIERSKSQQLETNKQRVAMEQMLQQHEQQVMAQNKLMNDMKQQQLQREVQRLETEINQIDIEIRVLQQANPKLYQAVGNKIDEVIAQYTK